MRIQVTSSDLYKEVKELVLSPDFPWHWHDKAYNDDEVTEGRTNFGFFSHVVLERPGYTYLTPKINSDHFPLFHDLFVEICRDNNIDPKVIYRINANLTTESPHNKCGPDHTDHDFPHKNMLIYLTGTHGGLTKVGNTNYSCMPNEAIVFEGVHAHMEPTSGRRVVLVYTFL